MECYAKAAKIGHARSAYNLAVLYLQSASNSTSDDQQHEAVILLEQAAGLGLKEVFLVISPALLLLSVCKTVSEMT